MTDEEKKIENEVFKSLKSCGCVGNVKAYGDVKAYDNVNRPAHYASSKLETIKIIKDKLTPEQFEGFLIGNVIKYVTRYRLKNGIEDLKKAAWYLDKAIKEKRGQK